HWEGAGVGREVEHEAVGAARPDAVGPDLDRTRGQAPERPEDRQEVPPPADRAEGPGPAAPARDAMGDLRIEPDPDHQAEEPPARERRRQRLRGPAVGLSPRVGVGGDRNPAPATAHGRRYAGAARAEGPPPGGPGRA